MKHGPGPLSPSQQALLERYERLLVERAVPLGLVARSDRDRIWPRHVLDCLRAAPLVRDVDRLAYDLGSGAGLPGVVLAIARPWCRFILVEARARRAGFLELVVDRLGLPNVEVAARRAEDLAEAADLATARAFAPLARAWEVAHGLLRPGGRLIYFGGAAMRDPHGAARGLEPAPTAVELLEDDVATPSRLVMMARG